MNTNTAKHTPGPWESSNSIIGCYIEGRPDYTTVATVNLDIYIESKEAESNAKLIAAAPELLEALEIQHACGEPEKTSLYDEECVDGWRWTHPDGREWSEIGDWNELPPMHPVARAAIAKATQS